MSNTRLISILILFCAAFGHFCHAANVSAVHGNYLQAQKEKEQKDLVYAILELDAMLHVIKESARLGLAILAVDVSRSEVYECAGQVAGLPDGRNAFDEAVIKICDADKRADARAEAWQVISKTALEAIREIVKEGEFEQARLDGAQASYATALKYRLDAAQASYATALKYRDVVRGAVESIELENPKPHVLRIAIDSLIARINAQDFRQVIPEIRSYFIAEFGKIVDAYGKVLIPEADYMIRGIAKLRFEQFAKEIMAVQE